MEPVMSGTLAALLIMATATDLRSGRIPNWLTLPTLVVALAVHTWFEGPSGLIFCLAGSGTGLGIFLLLYISGCVGAGDVKLMAAIGSIVGAYGALASAFLAIIVGGLYAIGAMCYQWGFIETGRKLAFATYGAFLTGGKVWSQDLQLPFQLRYGLAVAGGTLLFISGVHPFRG